MDIKESAWLRRYYRKAALLGLLMLATLPVYALIAEGASSPTAGAGGGSGAFLYTVLILSLLLLPAVSWVRRQVLGDSSGLGGVVDQVMVPKNRYRRMLLAVAVSLALCEIPALGGLLVLLSGGRRFDFYLLLVWSVLLMVVYFPRYGQWKGWFAQRAYFR